MLASMANQRASSSSACFTNSLKNQVFLSFRGEDTRHNFTDHLYNALCQRGINTFRDDDELRRGEEISRALLTAIEESKISVVVFSKNYASSKWCLDELVKILDCKESNQQLVIPVFYKVNPSDVRNQRGSFGDALVNMERRYKDKMDKVNKWRAALSQVAALSGFNLDEHQSESKFIQDIIEEISKHVLNTVCLEVGEHPVGMQAQVQVMNELLDLGKSDVRMVGVWGTGGIGKTTIAKAVYNSIAHEFEGCCFLANVRECSTSHGGLAKLQKTLLFEILRGKKLKVTNVDKGVTLIKEWLRRRKVLLVLDDVDDMEQLHKLVGACNWFGVGSRIIITTRDKQLLTAHDVNLIHEVKSLHDPEALELLSWYAFKRSEPPLGDYVKLAERAIRYAQGLPLALKVLGSHLYGGSIHKWQAALDGFQGTEIQEVLKISYNALDDRVKKVFLDITCFFKGKSRNYVTEACELNTRYGIDVLIEKALISVEGSHIQMHDLLEKMGKDIIEQESPTEPEERSRLWFHEDVEHVLTNNTGTNKITGIVLNFPKQDDEIFLDIGTSFSKMKNLKILINYNVCLSGDARSIPNNLRVLDWHGCPFQSFPANFLPKQLVVLNMRRSRIKQLGKGLKHFKNLAWLNLAGSQFLTEIPDLSSSPNLRYLKANRCTSLVNVHPSVGYLDKLEILDFYDCHKLTKFPRKVALKSLIIFRLKGCIKLESFPKIVGKMESLYFLDLERTAIKKLPESIGRLIGLEEMRLSESAIKELPSSIGNLTALEVLQLGGSAIEELPSSIRNLTALQRLNLEGCENLANLPQCIYGLQKLEYINLNRCPKLVTFPNNLISEVLSSSESLPLEIRTNANSPRDGDFARRRRLDFEECNVSDIDSLENFCRWSNLKKISLSKSNFVCLPVCISECVNLKEFDLRGCKRLVEILVQLPASIKWVHMSDCISLERFSTMSKILEDGDMQGISYMDLSNCHRLCDNLGLDVSKMAKLFNEMKFRGNARIVFRLPGSSSKVPEWFTFRNYLDDYDESKFDNLDHDGRSVRNYELPIEIPSTLDNAKLVLCVVWEITESFVSPCSLEFAFQSHRRDEWRVYGGETEAGNVWLECMSLVPRRGNIPFEPSTWDTFRGTSTWLDCIPLFLDNQLMPPIFRVTVSGKGLRVKSIGAHLVHNSMSRDYNVYYPGKHIDENGLDDIYLYFADRLLEFVCTSTME
ncbi:PREDICTED: TMV resistance [Prunus dulcis]|uniref:PREDICTED: TMV resistance n=1 Tax=Prunus dulcis TaxID=3755 RepID=A0A5E4G7R2_PRUDU|nr:PREDICTED: TMV resistance [Prunus dulcis]